MTPHLIRALAITALTGLAACSGGGSSVPGVSGSKPVVTPAATGHATLTFKRLASPASTTATAANRKTNELSYAANSLVIDATQTGTAPSHAVYDISPAVIGNGVTCGTDDSGTYQICSLQVRLPVGNDTVTVATNSARDGSGSTLGSATIPMTIVDARDNPFTVTLDGKVTSMSLFASDPSPNQGAGENIALTVQLYDATHTVLIAPQNYVQPIVLTDNDTGTGTELFTLQTQNSTQRHDGTQPASPAPSAQAKTVSVSDRYTVPYVAYTGSTTTPAFTVSATFGALTASATITPVTTAARPAGSSIVEHDLANTVRTYDPVFDASGKLWVAQTGGRISGIDTSTSTYTVTGTYIVNGTAGTRSSRSPILGPDGGIYFISATISQGVATAPYYVTRFDTTTHAFTDFSTGNYEVQHLTVVGNSIVAAQPNTGGAGSVWTLPFSGTTPGTPTTFAVATPAVPDTTQVLLPMATRVFPTGDGNLWVVLTSYAFVDGTWLDKYTPSGTKLSEARVDTQNPGRSLDAQAINSSGQIYYADLGNNNEFVRQDTSTGGLTTFAVPRLYGQDAVNEFTAYAVLDASSNLYFISSQDNRVGRIDASTGRVDLFNVPTGNETTYSEAIGPDGNLYVAGYNSGPFILTVNTH